MNKRESVLELFFNEPTRNWHFGDILKSAQISRPQAAKWLDKLKHDGLVKRIKPEGRMPYYIADYFSPNYQTSKRIFALNYLEKNGLLSHLVNLPKAQAVLLFGSMNRWDWHKESDIDIFIFGSVEGFEKDLFRLKLHRQIEVFACKDASELKNFNPALLNSIFSGFLIKGSLDFLKVGYA